MSDYDEVGDDVDDADEFEDDDDDFEDEIGGEGNRVSGARAKTVVIAIPPFSRRSRWLVPDVVAAAPWRQMD